MSIQVKLPNESITLLPLGQDMWEVQTAQGTAQKTSELVLQELKNRPIIYVSSNEDREKLLAALKPSSNDEVMEIAEEILPIFIYNQDNIDRFLHNIDRFLQNHAPENFKEIQESIKNDPISILDLKGFFFHLKFRDNKISVFPHRSRSLLLEVPIEQIKNRTIQKAYCEFSNNDTLLEDVTFNSVTFDSMQNIVFSNCTLNDISFVWSINISIEPEDYKIIAKKTDPNPEDEYFTKFFELSTKTIDVEFYIDDFLQKNGWHLPYLTNNSLPYINSEFNELFLKKLNDWIPLNHRYKPTDFPSEKNEVLYYLYFLSNYLHLPKLKIAINDAVVANIGSYDSFIFESSDLNELYFSNISIAEIFLAADNPGAFYTRYSTAYEMTIPVVINSLNLRRFKEYAIEKNLALLKNKDLDLERLFDSFVEKSDLNNFLQILIDYQNEEELIHVRNKFSEYIKKELNSTTVNNLYESIFDLKNYFKRLEYLCRIKDSELQEAFKETALIKVKSELNRYKSTRYNLNSTLDRYFNHQTNQTSVLTNLYDFSYDEEYKIKILEMIVDFLNDLNDEFLAPLIPSLLDVLSREKYLSLPFVRNFLHNKILNIYLKATDTTFVPFNETTAKLLIDYINTHEVSEIIAKYPNLLPQLIIYGLSLNVDDPSRLFFAQLEERYFSDPAVAPFIEAAASHSHWIDEKTLSRSIHQSELRMRLNLDLLRELGLVSRDHLEEFKRMDLESLKIKINDFRTLFNQLVEKHSPFIRESLTDANPAIDLSLPEIETSFLRAFSSLPKPKKLTVLNRSFLSPLLTEKKQLEDKQDIFSHLADRSSLIFLTPDLGQALVTDRRYVLLLANLKDLEWENVQIFSKSRKHTREGHLKIEHRDIHYENPTDLQKALEAFPLFGAPFTQFLNRSLANKVVMSLQLPLAYHQPLIESLQSDSTTTKWTAAQHQDELCDIFVPFFEGIDSIRPIPSTITLKKELLDKILSLFGEAGSISKANYLFVLSTIFAKASSASFFGTHNDSPDALRAFSLALFNEALKLNPNIIDNVEDIRNRLTGENEAFTCTDVLTNIMTRHCLKSTSKASQGEPSLSELYKKYFPIGWRSRYQ